MMTDAAQKQQSAMEYLMTYGWSILIIAIVLAALFSLGVFSTSNFGPRAQSNSCRVFRPNGPGTTTNINLEGVCNGELPEYVSTFSSGSKSIVDNGNTVPLNINSQGMTFSAWIYSLDGAGAYNVIASKGVQSWHPGWEFSIWSSTQIRISLGTGSVGTEENWVTNYAVPSGQWTFVAFTANTASNVIDFYGNGNLQQTTSITVNTILSGYTDHMYLGRSDASTGYFNGSMADVQLYDTDLDANSIRTLYTQGIGAAPISPQYIVGWWPLNGDTVDYSGDGSNGAQTAISFTSSWTSGYTTP